MNKRKSLRFLSVFIGALLFAIVSLPAFGADEVPTWEMSWGTFKLADRIHQKALRGEKLVFMMSFIDPGVTVVAGEIRRGIEDAAQEFGVDAEMVGPVGGNTEKQIAEIETLIAKGIDGLGVAGAVEDSMMVVINKAMEAGIPVVTFNCDNPGSKRLAAYFQSYEGGGYASGQLFLKHYKGPGGKVALLSCIPEGEWAIGRFNGFKKALAESGKTFTYVGPFNTTLEDEKAYAISESVYHGNKDLVGMYNNDQFVAQTGDFIERNNLQGKMTVIGMNLGRNILVHIEKGNIQGAVGQNLYPQGYMPIKVLYEFITEGKTVQPALQEVGGEPVDANNIGEYLK